MSAVTLGQQADLQLASVPRLRHVAERLVAPLAFAGLAVGVYLVLAVSSRVVGAIVGSPDVHASVEPFVLAGLLAVGVGVVAVVGVVGRRVSTWSAR